ncbi:MAG: hypothetical protein A3E12_03945 [Candidatus Levybacteria bacterium RIFCSPHIGHO2_12_FULL_39_9]|nr:MAG: hypothetical protein A3E12_03945 [Candidatus Levybacteria bacterium RIFCSPHIGHO2_12_FULL_39_9]
MKIILVRGFTLIELLIVIAVVGVLGTGVLVAIDPAGKINSANIAKAETFSAGIQNSLGFDLVGEWTFDDNTFKDTSGYGNNGMGINVTSALDRRDRNKASNFNGTAFINAGNGASLNLTNAGTIEVWIKISSYSAGTYPAIVSKGASAGWDTPGYAITVFTTTAIEGSIDNGVPYNSVSFGKPTIGFWHHLVFTWSGSFLRAFVDGSQYGGTVTQTINAGTTSDSLWIGNRYSYFYGVIDDVRVYKSALLSSQIKQLYAQGLIRHLLIL